MLRYVINVSVFSMAQSSVDVVPIYVSVLAIDTFTAYIFA